MTRILLTALAVVATCSAAVPVFEENHGQAPSSVKYLVRSPKGYAYLTGAGIALQRVGSSTPVSFTFEGASQAPTWTPETLAGRISYTIGRDQSRWVKDAPQYARLHLASLYPGIDAAFYQSAGSIEYDLRCHPRLHRSGRFPPGPIARRPNPPAPARTRLPRRERPGKSRRPLRPARSQSRRVPTRQIRPHPPAPHRPHHRIHHLCRRRGRREPRLFLQRIQRREHQLHRFPRRTLRTT